MSSQAPVSGELNALLAKNEALVVFYYQLLAVVLVSVMLAHVLFSAWFLVAVPANGVPHVLQFVAFKLTVLVVEVFLSRMTFILFSAVTP